MVITAEEKRLGIGGSDMAALLGLSKRRTRMQLWLQLVGESAYDSGEDNEAIQLGIALEPVILAEYGARSGVTVKLGRTLEHLLKPYLRGHTDGEVDGYPVGLEVKTAGLVGSWGLSAWGEEGTDQIPEAYLAQCHFYLGLEPAWDRMEVPALIAGRGLQVYVVERNEDLSDRLLSEAERFWTDYVLTRTPPDMDGSTEAAQWLTRKHPSAKKPLLESTPEVDALASALRRVRADRLSAERDEDVLKNQFRMLIGDARGVRGEWGRVLWSETKGKGGRRLDVRFNDEISNEEAA